MADASKASACLTWQPQVRFSELVGIMVDADMEAVGLKPVGEGKQALEEKYPRWYRWPSSVTTVLQNYRQLFE